MNTKEKCQIIRKEIKKQLGLTGSQMSVRKDNSSIRITAKTIEAIKMLDEAEKIAQEFQVIHRCEASQEILCGGNTFVFANIDWKLERAIIDSHKYHARAACFSAFDTKNMVEVNDDLKISFDGDSFHFYKNDEHSHSVRCYAGDPETASKDSGFLNSFAMTLEGIY